MNLRQRAGQPAAAPPFFCGQGIGLAVPPKKACFWESAAEQKARTTYDNLLRLVDDPDVRDPLKFLRQREVTHFQRFGDANRAVSSTRWLTILQAYISGQMG